MNDGGTPTTDHRWQQRANLSGLLIAPDGSLAHKDHVEARYRRRGSVESTPADFIVDKRTETERDRGRLSYSAQLRRLAGVTQVVSPDLQTSQLHSRASHTHKVALIAREIAEKLARTALTDKTLQKVIKGHGGLDIAACEAAGLAHDLGHPPFGHVGEHILEDQLRNQYGVWEGFEGNAQSFRIVTTLAHQKAGVENVGLALTSVTLAAILKYPYHRNLRCTAELPHGESHQKFGAYRSESQLLTDVRSDVLPQNTDLQYLKGATHIKPAQTLEASIMDLADDIAYSVHDLEDFCARGAIDVSFVHSELRFALQPTAANPQPGETNVFTDAADDLKNNYPAFFDAITYRNALTSVETTFGLIAEARTIPSRARFEETLRDILSEVVNEFFNAIRWDGMVEKPPVFLDNFAWHKMQVLKRVTKQYLVNTPAVGQLQRAQTIAMRGLLTGLVGWLQEAPSTSVLPEKLQDILAASDLGVAREEAEERLQEAHYRAIADYICTMSDSEGFEIAQWLSGSRVPSIAAGR